MGKSSGKFGRMLDGLKNLVGVERFSEDGHKAIRVDGEDYYLKIGVHPGTRLGMSLTLEDENGVRRSCFTAPVGDGYFEGTNFESPRCLDKGSTFVSDWKNRGDEYNESWEKVVKALNGELSTGYRMELLSGLVKSGTIGHRWITHEENICHFDLDKLREYDPTGFAEYEKAWEDGHVILQNPDALYQGRPTESHQQNWENRYAEQLKKGKNLQLESFGLEDMDTDDTDLSLG